MSFLVARRLAVVSLAIGSALAGCASTSEHPHRHHHDHHQTPQAGGTARIMVLPPSEQASIAAFDDVAQFKITPEMSGGTLTVAKTTTRPAAGPPPHVHHHDDEFFIVLEGEAEFMVDGAWNPVPVGTGVFIPRGAVHTFRNTGTGDLHLLLGLTPGKDFKRMFEVASAEFQREGGPDPEVIREICEAHGVTLVAP